MSKPRPAWSDVAPTELDDDLTPTDHSPSRSRSRSCNRNRDRSTSSTVIELANQQQFASLALSNEELWDMYPLGDCTGPSVEDQRPADSYIYPPSWPPKPVFDRATWTGLTQAQMDMAVLCNHANAFTYMRKSIMGGLDNRRETIRCIISTVPYQCQDAAANILDEVARIRGIMPMRGTDHPADYIAKKFQMNQAVYIGITERPVDRFEEHNGNGYSQMALWIFASSIDSASLEKQLIAKFKSNQLLRNIGQGGERASEAQPHFLYVVT
jgi:hypothetical protein